MDKLNKSLYFMAQSTVKSEMSVSEYCDVFKITRHAVHRRIKKYELAQRPVNNLIGVTRIGPKIIVLYVDNEIEFEKQ